MLTLGGLRYATVETEIYLLTTQFLDLRAAAALSVLQLVVVAVLLYAAQRTRVGARAVPGPGRASARPRRRPRRGTPPVLAVDRPRAGARRRAARDARGPLAAGRRAAGALAHYRDLAADR